MKFSVVTVCFNAEKEIEKTIKSVLSQNFCDYEFIVIDGLSSDSTLEIVKKYNVKYISEKDTGIYNAMNKGVSLSKGEWIIFMNAGDFFASPDVLGIVAKQIKNEICYGNVILSEDGLFGLQKPGNIDDIKYGMIFCHQSVFTKRELLLKNKYNEEFKVVSDYDFYLSQYLKGIEFQYIDYPVSVYALGGMSSKNIKISEQEGIAIRSKYNIPEKKPGLLFKVKTILRPLFSKKYLNSKKIKNRIEKGWINDYHSFIPKG